MSVRASTSIPILPSAPPRPSSTNGFVSPVWMVENANGMALNVMARSRSWGSVTSGCAVITVEKWTNTPYGRVEMREVRMALSFSSGLPLEMA